MVAVLGYSCDTEPYINTDSITLSWRVCEYPIGEESFFNFDCVEGIPDVEVCVINISDIPCTKTGSSIDDDYGIFMLEGLPKDSKVLLSFIKEGFMPRLVPVETGSRDLNWVQETDPSLLSDARKYPPLIADISKDPAKLEKFKKAVKECDDRIKDSVFSVDDNKGDIVAIALEFAFYSADNMEEVMRPTINTRVSISRDGNEEHTIAEPVYTNSKGIPCYNDPSDAEESEIGYALFQGLDSGEYYVKYDVPDNYFCYVADVRTNRMIWGSRTKISNQTLVSVEKGYRTITAIKCYDIYSSEKVQDGGTED